jgi:uncharacterized membrane protein
VAPVRPLQSIGLGLVLVVLDASAGDPALDLVPDPVGWVLVLLGVRRLPAHVGHQRLLQGAATVAGLVSLALWIPPLAGQVRGLDESMRWVLDLATPGFVLLLAVALSRATGDDRPARTWWQAVAVGGALTMLLPPVVYGAGAVGLALPAVVVAVGTLVAAAVLCFTHAARPWAHDAVARDRATSGG